MTQLSEVIETQPAVLRNVLELDLDLAVETLERAERISIVGTGSSQHAAELGARLLAEGGRNATWASSASFVRGAPDLSSTDAVVVISHTGESAFAQAARQRAMDADAGLVSLTGVGAGWPDAIELAPRELSETYTASYTAVLLALGRFARSLDGHLAKEEIESLPARVEGALGDRSLEELRPPGRLLTMIGSGFAAITAREGALKAREAAGLVSEGFEAEYFLHGQAVPLGSEDALVLVGPSLDPDGLVGALGDAGPEVGAALASVDEPPGLHPFLAQIPLTVRLQQLASRFADLRGSNPDRVIVGAWAGDDLWAIGRP